MDTLTETTETVAGVEYWHDFHAEANALNGELRAPIRQTIEPHVPVALNYERGGHLTRFTEDVSIEGLITFKKGRTHVSGSKSVKHQGWVTLSTSIVEGLNVFEVLTADRVVSQVSTDHQFISGHVPRVTFLGTRFEGLKLCGFEVTPTLALDVCGQKPKDDQPYLNEAQFLRKIESQVEEIASCGFLPQKMQEQYDKRLAEIQRLRKGGGGNSVTCSLIESIVVEDEKQIPGLKIVRNVVVIPDFGAVSLGEVEVGVESPHVPHPHRRFDPPNGNPKMSNYFQLTMLNMELGCAGNGTVKAAQSKTNGTTSP